jgi:hypothetical protein
MLEMKPKERPYRWSIFLITPENFHMSLREPSHNFSTPQPEPHARKRPASERKILANRKNALRSTGAKTERGKRAASRNAITHGILAREIVITAGDGEESQEEFDALAEELVEYYKPVGPMERRFVEKIAICWWRLGRAIRAENGELRKRLDTLSMDRTLRHEDEVNLALLYSVGGVGLFNAQNAADARVTTVERHSTLQAMDRRLREHPLGLVYLTTLLEVAKSEIGRAGDLSEAIGKKILLMFGALDLPFALHCRNSSAPETKAEGQPSGSDADKETETDPAFTLALIDLQLKKLSLLKAHALERKELSQDAEARSFSMPSKDATDKLLRYEAHIDRQLYRAKDELERLQRQRNGQNVPPPLNVIFCRRA